MLSDTSKTRLAAAWCVAAIAAVAGCGREDAPAPPRAAATAPAEPKPGGIVTNAVGMKFAYVPPGGFVMGSGGDEPGRHDDETQRAVTIRRGFHLSVTEVTQAQWQAVMGFNPSDPRGDDLPVSKVSWAGAADFCRKLSKAEGRTCRLPTEAEWEYACRAGTTGPFAGSGKLDEMGWHLDNSDERPHAVAGKAPNAWGLFDMHGNATEWCADWYERKRPASPAVDPTGPPAGKERVARGGSWGHFPRACRSAARAAVRPAYQLRQTGLRVLMEPRAAAAP